MDGKREGRASHDAAEVGNSGPTDHDLKTAERIGVTMERAKRTRAHQRHFRDGRFEFAPQAQPLYEPQGSPRDHNLVIHHDVLVVAPKGVHGPDEFFRVPVRKIPDPEGDATAASRVGEYRDTPELTDAYDHGQRKALSAARPADWGSSANRDFERGPAFSTLPIKPEPAASSSTSCYLVNAQNLNYPNAWTSDPWNGAPGSVQHPQAPGASETAVEALLAGPRGKVWRLRLDDIDLWPVGEPRQFEVSGTAKRGTLEIECIDLQPQAEIWNQLRNGCALGRAMFDDGEVPRVLPLLNITTLQTKSQGERGSRGSSKPAPTVAGTWDFKWPRGTQIRVGFQRPSGLSLSAFDAVRAQVQALAGRWSAAVRQVLGDRATAFAERGISFAFSDDWVFDRPLGSSISPGSELRSPFLPGEARTLEYDVLISLADLPLDIVDPFALSNGGSGRPLGVRRLVLPASLLGSYARRADHGAPTMFLGRFGASVTRNVPLREHLDLPITQYALVHEFGHALGLPHEHQNPNYAPVQYLPMPQLLESVRTTFSLGSLDLDESQAHEHLLDSWGESPEFSDWGKPTGTLYDVESVMAYPRLRDVLVPRPDSSHRQELITQPTATDVDNLLRMYRAQERGLSIQTAAAAE